MKLILLYLLIVNMYTFSLMAFDKNQAKHRKRRIPEKRLFTFAIVGGAAGIWLAMNTYRHKTLHNSFRYGMPVLLLIQLVILFMVYARTV